MRVVVAFALIAVACGLSVQGEAPAVVAPMVDAGTTSSGANTTSSTSSSSSGAVIADAGPDVFVPPVVSCVSLKDDVSVVRCLDFDDNPKYDEPTHRGFEDLNFDGEEKPAVSLEDSPLGLPAKKAFALRFTGTSDVKTKRELAATSTFPEFGAGLFTQVSLDADVTIDDLADFAVVVGFHFAGTTCNEFAGVAVNASRELLHWEDPGPSLKPIGTYTLGQPFHVHIEAHPGGAEKPLSVSINGGPLDSFQTALPYPACNYGAGFVGNSFASRGPKDTFHFRFDQIVLRAVK